jgi:NAD(P)-dependent dehydrogenase (short-subunit alcohol dehydrogenase family)
MRRQLHHFVKQGSGIVINNSSVYGSVGIANFGAYVASKHAIEGLTKTAALETAKLGIRVNAIAPAGVRTAIRTRAGLPAESDAILASHHPVGRLAEPDEVAAAVAYLASDEAAFITGTIFHLNGGYLAQ